LVEASAGARRIVLVTESVFSMDGDLAPLAALADACARRGARLVVDEAHATGVIGAADTSKRPGGTDGAGGWATTGRDGAHVVRVVTGGKALGAAGALVVCSAAVRATLIDRARTFAFTTAAPPAVVGALNAALRVCRRAPDRRARAIGLARRVARELGLPTPAAAIVPVTIGSPAAALEAAETLRRRDLHVRAVRPPTVPEHSSRLRIVCHAFNTDEEVERLIAGLREVLPAGRRAPGGSAAKVARATALFVAGTDTEIGKTAVAALLVRAARRAERDVAYWKPVQTGADDDTAEVARLADAPPDPAPGHRFALPASPHEAAAAEGGAVDLAHLDRTLAELRAERPGGLLVCELAGGLHVPLTRGFHQLDWLARLRPPLVLVARAGLGTLNHTLLSLEVLRARHLEPRALFLVGEPHPANLEYLRAYSGVATVLPLPRFDPLDGAALEGWLEEHDLTSVVAP
ncbi:MAG TPA: dethiobiotin synthase, partial [Myxococcota bacterium]|nr:dethiobiotin synthase [Myxococcota bacterium]